ncbi:MAG: 50S ribosomal protein L18 [Nitrososphaerota archaeon]|nr:50S ribosomal protein L18 [Candidatus Bathyarchaeota archaeon]MDW8048286.1 50S ribosomal protein L18 [Nitrososphaerota archaeon]
MAKDASYNVPYRRRREGKTDYRLRKDLILSGLPRIVIRKTRKYIIAQVIKATEKGDEVIASSHSRELRTKYGWLGNCDNLPASYLTGLICGYRAVQKGVKEAVLDVGLQRPTKGSRIFSALKGFTDAGVMAPYGEDVLPSESRISGEHIAKYAEKLSQQPELFSRIFSEYLSRGLRPEDIPEHFHAIKEAIISCFEKQT